MTEAARTSRCEVAAAPCVVRWVHESAHGQILGFDMQGHVVVTITTGPLFGPRLAAAFGPATAAALPDDSPARYGRPASTLASVASSQASG